VKPDGTSGLYDQLPGGGNATDIGDSTIKFILAPQMLTVPGLVRAALVLVKDTEQISTFPMDIHVTAQPGAGAVKSENYYHYTTFADLNNAIGNLDELETEAKSSLEAAINEAAKTGGSDSGQNVTLTAEQITALDNMFKVCAFIKEDVSAEYAAFQTAFGISGGEEEPDEPGTPVIPDEPETGVSNETTWTDGVIYTYDLVRGEYVNKDDGSFVQLNTWHRTPYLYCGGASRLRIEVTADNSNTTVGSNNSYNAFYDESKNFVSSFSIDDVGGVAGGYKEVEIPTTAKYFIVSHKATVMSTPYIVFIPCA
jgi:hypothetical protein